jgi:hypothetical protein
MVMALYIVGSSQFKHKTFFGSVFGVFMTHRTSVFVSPSFVLFSGALGLLLNISTFSLLGHASATSYVVVGAGKKIIQAILSYLFFDSAATWTNVLSVSTGLGGATIYTYLKWKDQNVAPIAGDGTVLLKGNSPISGTDDDIPELAERASEGLVET